MADGTPKDYSTLYREDSIPQFARTLPQPRSNNNKNNQSRTSNYFKRDRIDATRPIPKPPLSSNRGKANKSLDGNFDVQKHREEGDYLLQVAAKLRSLKKEDHQACAMDTLNKHYSSVFVNRRKSEQVSYRAYIQYFDERDTYVVRVDRNTLKAVRDKMPKRGNYRFFFKRLENTCEEIELDESIVPFHEKDGMRQIYCQVFPY